MEIEKINTNNKIKSIERIKKIKKIFVVGKGIDSTKEDESNKRQRFKIPAAWTKGTNATG